jgi:hypothetical protein
MAGQKFLALTDPILLMRFQGNQGMESLFLEEGKKSYIIDGTVPQGQMII